MLQTKYYTETKRDVFPLDRLSVETRQDPLLSKDSNENKEKYKAYLFNGRETFQRNDTQTNCNNATRKKKQ